MSLTKICIECSEDKPLEDFLEYKTKKSIGRRDVNILISATAYLLSKENILDWRWTTSL